jgi:hypothetical protein
MKTINDTYYHNDTPQAVINVLEHVRISGDRIRLFLGDAKTGESWIENNDVLGYVGRSTGPLTVPILLYNARSDGGDHILDQCIVAILSKKGWLYKHPTFTPGVWVINTPHKADVKYPYAAHRDGMNIANFETEAKATRFVKFMTGQTFGK